MSKPFSVRLPDDLAERLAGIAADTERSKAFHVQKAVEAYLDEYADLRVALDRLHDQADPVVSGRDLRRRLGV